MEGIRSSLIRMIYLPQSKVSWITLSRINSYTLTSSVMFQLLSGQLAIVWRFFNRKEYISINHICTIIANYLQNTMQRMIPRNLAYGTSIIARENQLYMITTQISNISPNPSKKGCQRKCKASSSHWHVELNYFLNMQKATTLQINSTKLCNMPITIKQSVFTVH